jgi:hypothetical protein
MVSFSLAGGGLLVVALAVRRLAHARS